VDSADSHFTGPVTVDGLFTYKAGMEGDGSVKNNGKDIGSTHVHDKTKPGNPGEKSGPPA